MTDIDNVLERCLTDLLTGGSTLDECLARYPEHALQLEPLLRMAARVERGSRVRPSPGFKVHARSRLVSHMRVNPRRKVTSISPFWRLMAGLAVIILAFFITGTVYAQGALPGDPLYTWKLTSEDAWRLVSTDPITTDLRIANRRIREMNVTVNDQVKWARALEGYRKVLSRLETELDSDALNNILPPAESFSHPDAATATPSPGLKPDEKATQDTNDKDQKDKNTQDNGKQDNGKDKDKGQQGASEPKHGAPVLIPTIEIPPPIR